MNRKLFTTVFAVILIGSFFLPYLKFGAAGSSSGFDLVTASGGRGEWQDMLMKYIWILIPLSGILLLIGAMNNENYIFGRGLWTWLPLLTVIFVIVKLYLDAKNMNGGRSVSVSDLVKVFGIGFWIATVASLLLAFYNPRSR